MIYPILEVIGLVNRFGEQLVHDGLNMEVHEDEVFGIVGGSGTGKSVLLRSILGLQRPQAGRVVDIEYGKVAAIETDQAIQRPQPEIAVPRLSQGKNRALRQVIRGIPRIHNKRHVHRPALSQNQRKRQDDEPKLDSWFQFLVQE